MSDKLTPRGRRVGWDVPPQKIQRTIPKNLFDGSISSTILSANSSPSSLLSSSKRDETRRKGIQVNVNVEAEKKKRKKEKVDPNTFRVFHLTDRASLSEGGEERQGRREGRSGRSIESGGTASHVVVRHVTRTRSHFHKFSQVLRQLVPSNSRRTVSPFPSSPQPRSICSFQAAPLLFSPPPSYGG